MQIEISGNFGTPRRWPKEVAGLRGLERLLSYRGDQEDSA